MKKLSFVLHIDVSSTINSGNNSKLTHNTANLIEILGQNIDVFSQLTSNLHFFNSEADILNFKVVEVDS